jgi:hypothetical protein
LSASSHSRLRSGACSTSTAGSSCRCRTPQASAAG